MFTLQDNIIKPERISIFPLKDIPIHGGLVIKLTAGENLNKLIMRVRNAVSSFKKSNKDYKLSVHADLPEVDQILVYRDFEEG